MNKRRTTRPSATKTEGFYYIIDFTSDDSTDEEDDIIDHQRIVKMSSRVAHGATQNSSGERTEEDASGSNLQLPESNETLDSAVKNPMYNNKLGSKPNEGRQLDSQSRPSGKMHIEEFYRDGQSFLVFHRQSVNLPVQTELTEDVGSKPEAGSIGNNDVSNSNRPENLKAPARSSVERVKVKRDYILKNKYHKCSVCGIFIHVRSQKSYIHHMIQNHGAKGRSIRMNSVLFNPKCDFCDSVVPSSSSNFNRHIKTVHRSKYKQKLKGIAPESKAHKYQRVACNKVGLNKNHSPKENKDQYLFKKILYSKNAVSKDKNIRVEPTCLVPKKVIFKCAQCQLHFTKSSVAMNHCNNCTQSKGGWECQKCQRLFEIADRKYHLRQHEFTGIFDIYVADSTLSRRILSKCPHCKLFLHEQCFELHCQSRCKTTKGYSCVHCDRTIHASSVKFHEELHDNEGYSGDDMICIEYVPFNTGLPSNGEMSKPKSGTIHNNKKEGKNTPEKHTAKQTIMKDGLEGSIRKRPLEKSPEVSKKKKDENLQTPCTSKEIKTRFELWKCACGLHFTTIDAVKSHADKRRRCIEESSVYCSKCNRLFDTMELINHLCKHHTIKNDVTFTITPVSCLDEELNNVKGETSGKTIVSTEDKKEKRNTMQNILYHCKGCNIHFMSSDGFNRHIKNNSVPKPVTCDICDLIFCKKAIIKHKTLQHDQLQLTRGEMQIYSTDECRGNRFVTVAVSAIDWQSKNIYRCDECNVHFSNFILLGNHLNKINHNVIKHKTKECQLCNLLFSSADLYMHRNRNHGVMRLTRNELDIIGSATLYKCAKCPAHFVKEQSLDSHLQKNEHDYPIVKCRYCALTFTEMALLFHETVHHRTKLINRDFKIFQKGLGNTDADSIKHVNGVENNTTSEPEPKVSVLCNYSNKLYRCDKCSIHFTDESSFRKHQETNIHTAQARECSICALAFDSTDVRNHIKIHHQEFGLIRKEDFNIISELNKTVKVVTARADDSILPQSGPASRADNTPDKTIKETNIKLYKCGDCEVHFLSHHTCYQHTLNHEKMKPIEFINCKMCGLQFKTDTLQKHMIRHHQTESFKIEDVLIDVYHPNVLNNGTPTLNIYPAKKLLQRHEGSNANKRDLTNTSLPESS